MWGLLVLGLTLMWARKDAGAAATLLTILSGAAAVTQFLSATKWKPAARASSAEQVDAAADALAAEVRKQWEAEARRRSLDRSRRLPVRCRIPRGSHEIDLDQFVADFADDPRRTVVVGEPGSGKTGLCLLLTLELLRRPEARRVPVLLQISAWNPAENLDSWLLSSLLDIYPFLANESRYGPTAARELLNQDRILLVLDGLDELAEDQRPAALRALDADLGSARPSVLTCRAAEFAAANAGGVISDSHVVELLPLPDEAIAGYLRESTPQASVERWAPVLADLTERTGTPLGHALRTPLMLSLARAVYADPRKDPAALLRVPDAEQVEATLLDEFTRQAFTTRPPSPLQNPAHEPPRWNPEQAERWLSYLAREFRDLSWWRLWRAVPTTVFVMRGVLVGGPLAALLGWLLLGLFGQPGLGLLLGAAIGVSGGTGLGLLPAEAPRRFVPRVLRRGELGRDLLFGAVGAVAGGVAVGVLWGGLYGVAIGLVFGVAYGMVRRFTEPTEPTEAVTPESLHRDDKRAVLFAAGLGAVLGGLAGGFLGGVVGVSGLGLVVPVAHPVLVGLLGAAVGVLLGAGGLGLAIYATSASSRFNTARLWLALRGRTPVRLMAFLRDAHRLGVLRLVGPTYQFRHELLRDRLARRS
ncbi:NACHT domain-containing protein [Actinokineospora iranica]|uniref:NACHT domain-containing protein n=1 Tax=Actinokineospora iranica TaxID=1271860 RepID=A0A1G6U3B4_9PSEU|nr:NACHT domain-containing protein [Actinokineospora iranica]